MDVWTCCQCKGNNLIANAPERCPLCSHTRCSRCPTGRPGLKPVSSTPRTRASTRSRGQLKQSRSLPPPLTPHLALPLLDYPMASRPLPSLVSNTPSVYPSLSFTMDPLLIRNRNGAQSLQPSLSPYTRGNRATVDRPSMAGWWYCCQCGNLNNPVLCGGRCMCGHQRCIYCRAAIC